MVWSLCKMDGCMEGLKNTHRKILHADVLAHGRHEYACQQVFDRYRGRNSAVVGDRRSVLRSIISTYEVHVTELSPDSRTGIRSPRRSLDGWVILMGRQRKLRD